MIHQRIHNILLPKLLNTELKKKEDTSNKVTSINDLSTDTQYPSAKLLNTELKTKEDVSNKTTVISVNSTDNEYPTAKAVHSIASTKLDKSDAFSKNYNDLTNKPTIPTKTSDLTNDSNFITEHQDINGKEDKSNKVTSISADSTDTQYPSAKCVYDLIENIDDTPGTTPSSHNHGYITDEGTIGSTANLPLITGTNGVIQTGSFGIDAHTFCEGDDPRLSDRRNPKFINIDASSTNKKDLNTYINGGFYYCKGDNAVAPYIANCPITPNKSFFLLVETWGESSNYVKQTLTYYTNQKTYVRTKMNTAGWSPWYLVQTTNVHIPSTHSSSTSAWTGTSSEIATLAQGTVIYYFLKQEPTTSSVTLNLTLVNGDTTGAKNVYFDSSTRLSNQYKKNSMIGLYYSGSEWFVISPYNGVYDYIDSIIGDINDYITS